MQLYLFLRKLIPILNSVLFSPFDFQLVVVQAQGSETVSDEGRQWYKPSPHQITNLVKNLSRRL